MMRTAEMLKVFQQYRGDAIVIPGRGGRHWVQLSTSPSRDVPLGDPAMGGHASFGLGLALALPDRKVVLFDSEGDVLMGDYTAVGTNSVIMPANEIPEGTVIGALSFVPPRFSFEPWSVYAGTPIRKVGDRNRTAVAEQANLLRARLASASGAWSSDDRCRQLP